MINAFGDLVIQGNLIVGVVVFLVITFVQFIVIAKGSERVAEVSARFTLDALPGKQMSIDADVRAGAIDYQTARRKREELQLESRFYGALDGAMKFVKGDAIAGIVITAVNVIGGLAVGVFVFGLDLQSAVGRFTLLTIGDGLLSQIPALLNSLAAGMIVTRVVGTDGGVPLAREVLTQLGQIPKVKLLVGGLALLFAIVPGLPALPFLVLGSLLFMSALSSLASVNAEQQVSDEPFLATIPPVVEIRVPEQAFMRRAASGDLVKLLSRFQQLGHESVGLLLSQPAINPSKEEDVWEVRFRGLTFAKLSGLEEESEIEQIERTLQHLISTRLIEFVDDVLTRRMLDHFDVYCPELVSAVVPNLVSVTQLTKLLRELIEEEVSVHNFDQILQAVAESGQSADDESQLLASVRSSLHRVITHHLLELYGSDGESIEVYALSPLMALELSDSVDTHPGRQSRLLEEIASFVSNLEGRASIILTSSSSRKIVRDFLRARYEKCVVIAHEEISPDTKVEVVATIEGSESDRQSEQGPDSQETAYMM